MVVSHLNNCFNDDKIEYSYNAKKHADKFTSFEAEVAGLSVNERLEKRIKKSYDIIDQSGKEKSEDDYHVDTARLLLEKNLVEKSNDSETFRAMAAFYSSYGFIVGNTHVDSDFKLAFEYLGKAIQADPNNLKANLDLMRHLTIRGAVNDAMVVFQRITANIDDSKVDYETARKLMSVFFRTHQKDKSNEYFEMALKKAPTDEDKAYLYGSLAGLNVTENNYKGCVEYYEKSLQLNDKVAWNFGNVADCYNRLQMYDKAIERARKAISLMDYGVAHGVLADSYVGKGEKLFLQRKYQESEENFKLALMEQPRADVYLNLARNYMQTGEKEKEQEATKNALLAADEEHPRASIQKALNKLTQYFKHRAEMAERKIAQEKDMKRTKLNGEK